MEGAARLGFKLTARTSSFLTINFQGEVCKRYTATFPCYTAGDFEPESRELPKLTGCTSSYLAISFQGEVRQRSYRLRRRFRTSMRLCV